MLNDYFSFSITTILQSDIIIFVWSPVYNNSPTVQQLSVAEISTANIQLHGLVTRSLVQIV